MSQKNLQTNFSNSPYFDDYDEQKKFYRILFRPGYPVQSRELTQMQTILNNQIGRFGESIYEDGSIVTGTSFSLTDNEYIKLPLATSWATLSNLIIAKSFGRNYQINDQLLLRNSEGDTLVARIGANSTYSFSLVNNKIPSSFFGKIQTENFSVSAGAEGAQFEVNVKITTNADPVDGREERPIFLVQGFTTLDTTDNPTLFGTYLSGTEFVVGDTIAILDEENETTTTNIATLESGFNGTTQLASVTEGIVFTNGFFAYVSQQTVPISKFGSVSDARIGLFVEEDIVTEQEDPTLYDNAAGSANENAPGAHRFRINLNLEVRDTEPLEGEESSFYQIALIENGEIVDRKNKPEFSTIGDEMAKQLYDVNGNFIIEPFKITFEDKLLFSLTVDSHTQGNETLNVTASQTVTTTDLIGKIFDKNDIPYEILNAVDNGSDQFTLTLSDVPSFVQFAVSSTIDIVDKDVFQALFTPGDAYVNGRNFATLGTTKRDITKTRTTDHLVSETDKFLNVSFGNYLVLDDPSGTDLSTADFDSGSVFTLHGDNDASDAQIGTARVKQFKSTVNNRMEMYFFDAKFDTVDVSTVSGSSGSDAITSTTSFEDRHAGATFVFNNVRYKIESVSDSSNATLTTPLSSAMSSETITLNYEMSAVKSIKTSDTGTVLAVSNSVIADNDNDGYSETSLLETDKRQLIFNVSEDVAKDLANVQYTYRRTTTATVDSANITVSLDADETLAANLAKDEFLLYDNTTNARIPSSEISTISPGTPGGTATITLDNSGRNTNSVIVSYPVIRTSAQQLTTSFVYGNNKTVLAAMVTGSQYIDSDQGQSRIPASAFTNTNVLKSIGLTNVYRIREIYELDSSATDVTVLDTTSGDFGHSVITDNFNFDNGQRDDIVDHAKISLKAGSPIPTGDVLVVVDRITTDAASLGSATYYSVDSYNELYYDYLPEIFTSSGKNFDLRSAIDFRPRAEELAESTNLGTWDETTKTFSQLVFVPDASNTSLVQLDVDYYVSRMDKVVITPDLDFKVLAGVPDISPQPPVATERALTLYDIYQYPFSTVQNDIETAPYNHDRYQMSDIATLNERIGKVEKTIQLDRVQKAILSSEIKNETNTSLFKTGVLVDSFSNTSVADVSNTDFRSSLDKENSQLKAAFDQYSFSLFFDTDDVNTTAKITQDGIVLADYDDDNPVTLVDQKLATRSENLNPFSIVDWLGEVKLYPEKDFWKDITKKPAIVTNLGGDADAWKFIEESVQKTIGDRTEYGSWETRWTGKPKVVRKNVVGGIFGRIGSWFTGRKKIRETTETKSLQEKSITTSSFDTQIKKQSLGDKVVDQSVIPIMRSVPGGIRFLSDGLKPNSVVYPFFDDVDVLEYVRPGVIYEVEWNNTNRTLYYTAKYGSEYLIGKNETINGETVVLTGLSATRKKIYIHYTPNSRSSSIYGNVATSDTITVNGTVVDTADISKVIDQKISGSFRLKTDPSGEVSGIFDVPEDTFKTGTRTFKLTDSSGNVDGSSTTNAEKNFSSSGLSQTVREQIVSTRVPTLKKKTTTQTRTVTSTDTRVYSNSPTVKRWKDPIAQTFNVDSNTYPSGLYLHSVDLWFTSVDNSLPVTVQIRTMNNGYPSNFALPLSEVTLPAAEIVRTGTPDQSNYTRFKFSTPVYLQNGEYAITILTNSLNYEIYSAVMGERVLSTQSGLATERVMNKQPFSGKLFKSQNASSWTFQDNEDIMFRANRVSFNTGTYKAMVDTEFDNEQLNKLVPFKSTTPPELFTYDAGQTNSKFSYNQFIVNVPEVSDFEDIVEPTYKVKTSSLNESTGVITPDVSFRPLIVNKTQKAKNTLGMTYKTDTTDFQLELTFGTNDNAISPMFDEQEMNVIFIQNIIDDLEIVPDGDITILTAGSGYSVGDTFTITDDFTGNTLGTLQVDTVDPTTSGVTDFSFLSNITDVVGDTTITPETVSGSGFTAVTKSELDPSGGVAESKYISKRVNLKSGFESRDLKVVMSAYRPQGTSIYVYYKIQASEDTDLFENKGWNLMYELSNSDQFSIEETDYIPLEFVTYKQLSDGSIDETTRGGVTYNSGGTVYRSFSTYAIKVVMASDSTNRTPILQNLGATALVDPVMK